MDVVLKLLNQLPKDNWQWELDTNANNWDKKNALSLANLSALAYGDSNIVPAELKKRGFDWAKLVPHTTHDLDVQFLIGQVNNVIVLAFGGTEPTDFKDIHQDTSAIQVSSENILGVTGWGKIHRGFADGFRAVKKQLLTIITENNCQHKTIWLTGHSLGGALATVAAAWFSSQGNLIGGIYTFGQPRVGDSVFKKRYEEKLLAITYRCVNNLDPVPRLPPKQLMQSDLNALRPNLNNIFSLTFSIFGNGKKDIQVADYTHVGILYLFMKDGKISNSADEETKLCADEYTARSILAPGSIVGLNFAGRIFDHALFGIAGRPGYTEQIEK